MIYQRSEGNPLFMVNVVDYLVAQGPGFDASKLEAPHNLRQMIERNLERLTEDEQRVLEGASVAGAEFSAAAVAAALERSLPEVEACCTKLARREQFVSTLAAPITWPDGVVAAGFRFHHALYQETLYARLPAGHRIDLHRRIAQREEAAYGERAGEIAAELGYHYERANDHDKAVKYFQQAGERTLARGAMIEAERHYRRALERLRELPADLERDHRELDLQMGWGRALPGVKGWSHKETHRAFSRAQELAEKLGESHQLATLMNGLSASACTRGQMSIALEQGRLGLRSAEFSGDRALICAAHRRLGESLWFGGKFDEAGKHLDLASSYFDEADAARLTILGAIVPSVIAAIAHVQLGFADRGRKLIDLAQVNAGERNNSFELAFVHMYACVCALTLRDATSLRDHADALKRLTGNIPFLAGHADAYAGEALFMLGQVEAGKALVRQGIAFWRATEFGLTRTWELEIEPEFNASEGRLAEAMALLAEALSESEQVLWRRSPALLLRADLLLRRDAGAAEVEAGYRNAIECALEQGSRLHQMEATTHLARWLNAQSRRDEARTMLAAIYNRFTEGFDTLALKEAKTLLDELML